MARQIGIQVFYDSEADIFEIVKDPARLHVSRELEHGLFVHLDPKTNEVVGFAIHHFSQDFSGKPTSLPIAASFQPLSTIKKDLALRK